MARKIQFKRGLKASLPKLSPAELAFTTDEKKAYIGDGNENIRLLDQKDKSEITTHLAEMENEIQAVASGSPKGTFTSLSQLQKAYPNGDNGIYIVSGNVREVDTLTITGTPSSSGNVTITLNGVPVIVAVSSGVPETASITINTAPTSSGNIQFTLNEVDTTQVSINHTTENTPEAVAGKIRSTSFAGWTTGGTGNVVTFTANTLGDKYGGYYSPGTTGMTATMTTTTQGTSPDTPVTVATKIRNATFSGWTTGGTGATVIFTKNLVGKNTPPVYSPGSTGANGSIAVTISGSDSDGNWYYWSGTTWTAGGVYLSTGWIDALTEQDQTWSVI